MSFQAIADLKPTDALLVPFLQRILAVYARYGREPTAALRHAGIDAGVLQSRAVPLSMAQLMAFSQQAMHELNDEGLGLYSRPLPWGSFGLIARGSLTAPNLRVAMQRWVRHQNIVVPDLNVGLEERAGCANITLLENRESWDSPLAHELALVLTLRCILGCACWLVDSVIPLIEARLSIETTFQQSYAHLFDGRLHMGGGPTRLCFDSRYLDLPRRRNEADLEDLLRNEAKFLGTYRYQNDRLLVSRVRDLLNASPNLAAISANAIAASLHVSTRTLHRQLKDGGTSLRELQDGVRKAKALHLLGHTHRPVKHIAQTVGFAHEQNFIRAFRRWTGESPLRFRQKESSPDVVGTEN